MISPTINLLLRQLRNMPISNLHANRTLAAVLPSLTGAGHFHDAKSGIARRQADTPSPSFIAPIISTRFQLIDLLLD